MNDREKADWIRLYQEALIDTDPSTLPGKIELATGAVHAELAKLPSDSRQRDILMDAVRTLRALRREAGPG